MVARQNQKLPRTANHVMIAKPSARPTRSTNLAVGNLKTPPTMLETMLVVETSGRREKEDVT